MSDTEQQMNTQAAYYRQLHARDRRIDDLLYEVMKWQCIALGLGTIIVVLLTVLVWG